jgi:pyruvate-formate lyase-activating enzyme
MELLTLAGIGTIILTAALTRGTEMTLEGGIDQLKKIVQRKSPNTFKQLEAAAENSQVLPETVKIMATLIEEDEEVKAVAEKVADENKNNPNVMNQLAKIKQTGLEDFEAEELEGEIKQKAKEVTNTNVEQVGAKGVKIKGKATLKINQNIE